MRCRIVPTPSDNLLRIALRTDIPPLGVYIHWPFCLQICPYCDFNVYKNRAVDEDLWLAAYGADLDAAQKIRSGPVETVFFGGGTPALMTPRLIGEILSAIDQRFGLTAKAEISLEANPDGLGREHLNALAAVGITRLSLGIQSLDDAALKFLGRHHTAAQALSVLQTVQEIFPAHSADLIYARPGQTAAAWQQELDLLLACAPEHVSLYELTIEPNTSFGYRAARGDLVPLSGDMAADLYDLSAQMMSAYGLPAYEISNHARADTVCRHNLATWQGGDYIGIGPGAHGRITGDGRRHATEMHADPAKWVLNAGAQRYDWARFETLSALEAAEELFFLSMRLADGISHDALTQAAAHGLRLNQQEKNALIGNGLLEETTTHLRCTQAGMKLLDYSIGRMLAR